MQLLDSSSSAAAAGVLDQNEAARSPVAVIMSRFPSVTETFILREMIELERQGQPVRLAPMLRDNPPVLHPETHSWIERALYTPYLSGPILRAVAKEFVRRPFRVLSLFARLFAGTLAKPGTFARTMAIFPKSVYLAGALERDGVRHIHAHFATHPTTIALIVSQLSNITFSFTVHAHDIQLDRSLLRWKLREARFVRSISEFNKRFLEALYPKETKGKIEVIHVGIVPEEYSHAQAVTQEVPKLLCVAAHKPYKGLPVLIEACRILRDKGFRFHCEVVGHGPMTAQLQKMIDKDRLSNVIALVGPRSASEVSRMMGEASFFVLPSIVASDGQMEGIPVALMEAMASGRAVVTTSISGIPELVEDRRGGLVVAPGDPVALSGAMQSLLENPQWAEMLGRRGREKVIAEFALRDCTAKLAARLRREIGATA